MSFLNKIKGWGQKEGAAAEPVAPQDAPFIDAFGTDPTHAANMAPELPGTGGTAAMALDVPTMQQTMELDTSIISEAAPSEMADFSETRMQEADAAALAAGTGLPLIGNRPVAEQQRLLIALIVIGVIGLLVMTVLSVLSASRGSAQVGASGQALMQSQRLAKSVSQALIGSATAFPEVRESADVLARNVRSL